MLGQYSKIKDQIVSCFPPAVCVGEGISIRRFCSFSVLLPHSCALFLSAGGCEFERGEGVVGFKVVF